jgi:hypothetical protein
MSGLSARYSTAGLDEVRDPEVAHHIGALASAMVLSACPGPGVVPWVHSRHVHLASAGRGCAGQLVFAAS